MVLDFRGQAGFCGGGDEAGGGGAGHEGLNVDDIICLVDARSTVVGLVVRHALFANLQTTLFVPEFAIVLPLVALHVRVAVLLALGQVGIRHGKVRLARILRFRKVLSALQAIFTPL